MSSAPLDPQADPAVQTEPGDAGIASAEPEPAAVAESSAPDESRSLDHRRERIRVQTTMHRIEGNVTLARDGFRSRVSDMLNASERDFLILTDATIATLDGGPPESHRFLALARRHIVFAVLADTAE